MSLKSWTRRTRPWLLAAALIAACSSNHASPAAPTPTPTETPLLGYSRDGYQARLVSTTNRHDLAGGFEGGWGPHLRSFLRDPDDSLWYVIDVGATVEVDTGLDYYRLTNAGEGGWQQVATQPQIAGIQQNVATVLTGQTIYSYGVDNVEHRLEECTLDTVTALPGGCSVLEAIQPNSNYVGAAVTPAGDRLVWWTTVATTSGEWSYVIGNSAGWTAPVVTVLDGFGFLGYVYLGFVDSTDLVLAGQVIRGQYGTPEFQLSAAVGQLALGQPLSALSEIFSAPGVPVEDTEDIWVDSTAGVVEFAGSGAEAGVTLPNDGSPAGYPGENVWTLSLALAGWTPGTALSATHYFPGAYRARFRQDADETLHLLLGRATPAPSILQKNKEAAPLRDYSASKALTQDPIDWPQKPFEPVPMPPVPGYGWIDGIWVESSVYQTTPVKGTNFGFTGEVGVTDNDIWQVQNLPQ